MSTFKDEYCVDKIDRNSQKKTENFERLLKIL